MSMGKKRIFLGIVLILSIMVSAALLSGCFQNYSKAFSITPPFFKDGENESNNNDLVMDSDNKEGNNKDNNQDINSDINESAKEDNLKEEGTLPEDGTENEKGNLNINHNNSDANDDNNNDKFNENEQPDNENDLEHNDNTTVNDDENDGDKSEDNEESEKEAAIPAAKIIRNSTDNESKRVAITFDDGPDGRFTPQILDVLKEYDTKATFFILGSNADKHRDVLKRIGDEGHVVASHSWGHKDFTKISQNQLIEELQKTDELIEDVVGKSHHLFRLPYGAFNKNTLRAVANQGFHNIYWSIDPKDWSGISPKKILDNIKANIEPGAIILLHSSGSANSIPNTVKALPQIIEFLQEQGYEIVTIPDLLEDTLYQ